MEFCPVSICLVTWVNMLCAGPLGKGQQGWCGVVEEEEGRGVALIGRRHPNPIADCSHTAGKEERGGKEKRVEISKCRAEEEKQEEREGERQTHLTVGVKGKVLVQVRAVLRSCTPQK